MYRLMVVQTCSLCFQSVAGLCKKCHSGGAESRTLKYHAILVGGSLSLFSCFPRYHLLPYHIIAGSSSEEASASFLVSHGAFCAISTPVRLCTSNDNCMQPLPRRKMSC